MSRHAWEANHGPDWTATPSYDVPSVDASGACTCCGYLPPRAPTEDDIIALDAGTFDAASGDEAPCACLGDDCPDCGACLLAHCECDPGDLDEDQLSPPAPTPKGSGRWPAAAWDRRADALEEAADARRDADD